MDREKSVRVSSDNKKNIDISGECCHWFIETSVDAIGVRTDHKFVYCNSAMVRLLGAKSRHELIGKSIFDFVAPEHIEMVRKRICEASETDRPLSFVEEKLKRLDGRAVVVEASSMHVNYYGKPSVMCIFHDITERKQIEQELSNSEQRYHLLMENANDAVFLAEVETGRLVDCNSKAEQLLGISRKEILGSSYKKLHPKDSFKEAEAAFLSFVKDGHGTVDTLVKKEDGTSIWVNISGTAFELQGKKYALGLFRDITKRKKMEIELEESELELREQKNVLERKNAALEELLERIEVEKKKIKTQVASNVNTLLVPVLERMRRKKTYSSKYIDLVEQNLKGMVSSFGLKLSRDNLRLSPREVEICNMIKNGFKTKEISGSLNISQQTVDRHRNNIRKKLGIVKKEVNLVSFLQQQPFV